MKQFFVNTAFPIQFRPENIIRKLSTSVEVCFSDRPFFLSKNIEMLRSLNDYQICKWEKEKFQTIEKIIERNRKEIRNRKIN